MMKRILTICLVLFTLGHIKVSAQTDKMCLRCENSDSVYTIFQNRTRTVSTSSYKDVTVTAPGTLAQALGSDADIIDSLVVRGPINDNDFNTIWSATFHGNLAVVNLEHA